MRVRCLRPSWSPPMRGACSRSTPRWPRALELPIAPRAFPRARPAFVGVEGAIGEIAQGRGCRGIGDATPRRNSGGGRHPACPRLPRDWPLRPLQRRGDSRHGASTRPRASPVDGNSRKSPITLLACVDLTPKASGVLHLQTPAPLLRWHPHGDHVILKEQEANSEPLQRRLFDKDAAALCAVLPCDGRPERHDHPFGRPGDDHALKQ